jgi:hypothetical protein
MTKEKTKLYRVAASEGPKPTTLNHKFKSFPDVWQHKYPPFSKAEKLHQDLDDEQKKEFGAWVSESETETGNINAIRPEKWGQYFGIAPRAVTKMIKSFPLPEDKERKRRKYYNVRLRLDRLGSAAASEMDVDKTAEYPGMARGAACSGSGNTGCKSI